MTKQVKIWRNTKLMAQKRLNWWVIVSLLLDKFRDFDYFFSPIQEIKWYSDKFPPPPPPTPYPSPSLALKEIPSQTD